MLADGVTEGVEAATGAAAGVPGGFHSFAVGFGLHSFALARRADFFFSASAAAATVAAPPPPAVADGDDSGGFDGVDGFAAPAPAAVVVVAAAAAAAAAALAAAGTNAGAFVDTLDRDPLFMVLASLLLLLLPPVAGATLVLGEACGVVAAALAFAAPAFGDTGAGVAVVLAAGAAAAADAAAAVLGPFSPFGGGVDLCFSDGRQQMEGIYEKPGDSQVRARESR